MYLFFVSHSVLGAYSASLNGVYTSQASTVRLGADDHGNSVNVPFKQLLPMVDPNDIVVGGWDICGDNLGDAMRRAKVLPDLLRPTARLSTEGPSRGQVLEPDLQRQVYDEMSKLKPLPSVLHGDFIAANQSERATNVKSGGKQEQLEQVRADIRAFRAAEGVDKVIVLWTANTERFAEIQTGVNDSARNLLAAIEVGEEEISPSTIFAVASVLEGASYINGSPQNTFVPGLLELAEERQVFIGGDDFKSGQTKVKSVLVDFLISAGIKVKSIVSYNHLGNNDGKNLSDPMQFRSKEISKSNVVDDMVASNRILYAEEEHPDHVVVIKYVPAVGDSKRAMDEYTSEIFMGGTNTIVMHNTCEDSLLAAPIILDLVILTELFERVSLKRKDEAVFARFHPVLSVLSYLLKAPLVPSGTPVVNALFTQRQACSRPREPVPRHLPCAAELLHAACTRHANRVGCLPGAVPHQHHARVPGPFSGQLDAPGAQSHACTGRRPCTRRDERHRQRTLMTTFCGYDQSSRHMAASASWRSNSEDFDTRRSAQMH